jgi:hypothetical protein
MLATGVGPVLANVSSPAIFESPQQLVEALMRALNTEDAPLLAQIYQVLNLKLCNSFEALVVNVVLRTNAYSPLLVFENLKESKAVLTVPPRIVRTVSESGRTTVVFGFRWYYLASTGEEEDSEEIDLVVTWETQQFVDGWRVVGQRTSPCVLR